MIWHAYKVCVTLHKIVNKTESMRLAREEAEILIAILSNQ